MSGSLDALADAVLEAVFAAGAAILVHYRSAGLRVHAKADDSPVTRADLDAHAVLCDALVRIAPGIPILSEEGEHQAAAERAHWSRCWIVDPLDGTREFLAQNDQFTVNVALVEHGRPLLGVVGVPARGEAFVGLVPERRAWRATAAGGPRIPLHTRPCPADPVVLASRSHRTADLEALLGRLRAAFPAARERAVGSALKLVELASGDADVYPRRGPCAEWDIAAGEAVLEAAGGLLRDFDGQPLRYNKAETLLNPDFWAVGDPDGPLRRWLEAGKP
ncbi:MAG: 3'(2'),5'-bisphosphate nucleotidase CysQ [Pseudomonadales bacterium]|jgi:3'(2'), 5'-bisphosphate nucleotidase|nr:3'(2'),5'-bisphosphate nucleotidase CysQ [Pseudomonadales bacterium]